MTVIAPARIGLVTAGVFVGMLAASRAYDLTQPWLWGSDLAVTIAFAVVAALAVPQARARATLAGAVAATWCLAAWLPFAVFWHRGALIHLLVLLLAGGAALWPVRRLARVTVVAGYAVSITPWVWGWDAAALALAVALAAAGIALHRRGAPALPLAALLLCSAVLAAAAAVRMIDPSPVALGVRGVGYALGLVAVAALVGLSGRAGPSPRLATDAVVELGARPDDAVRDRLAAALGDRSLQVAWWSEERAGFVAGDGREVLVPPPGDRRTAILVESDGRAAALVVGDAVHLDAAAVRSAVGHASRLGREHRELAAHIRTAIGEVESSRARLISAADAERAALAAELEHEVGAPLRVLGARLAEARADDPGLARAAELAERALGELDDIARGLHPSVLDNGLAPALAALAARTPAHVALRVEGEPDRDAAAARVAYYVCAEAVANAVRHAHGAAIALTVAADEQELAVRIADDGAGGADPQRGTGLAGLRERVVAHGGTLTIDSPRAGGTTVRATLPVAPSEARMLEGAR